MKILHVIPSFYPATYFGGPIESTWNLCKELSLKPSIKIKVLTTNTNGPSRREIIKVKNNPMSFRKNLSVYYAKKNFGRDFSIDLLLRLYQEIFWADVIHLTGVYSFTTFPTLIISRLLRKRIVWSCRGSLQRWKDTKKKTLKFVWEILINILINNSETILHVTSELELKSTKKKIRNVSCALIPNGINVEQYSHKKEWIQEGKLRIIFLGRIDPIKGLENLIMAISRLDKGLYLLKICGTGDKEYVKKLKVYAKEFGLEDEIEFTGHMNNQIKARNICASDILILPSYSENFGMVIIESLSRGTPVIVSKKTPWEEVTNIGCGFWVDNDPDALADVLVNARKSNLREMGMKGYHWVKQKYSSDKVTEQMYNLYLDNFKTENN